MNMWSPTHVQVTVQRARGLLLKGKNGLNDCFVTIVLGNEKFQTSVKEKCGDAAEWREECDLLIPAHGNRAELVLTAYHRNFVADQFLGRAAVPLADLDVYETPRNKWYPLHNKPGKDDSKRRGEIEVKIGFTVKREERGPLLAKERHKSSVGQLSQMAQGVGGSLLSIGSADKRKGIKKFAKNLGSKISLNKKEKKSEEPSPDLADVTDPANVTTDYADPGVISEDEDEFAFDDLSHKSSGSSLNVNNGRLAPFAPFTPAKGSPANASLENLAGGELLRRSTSGGLVGSDKNTPPSKPVRLGLDDLSRSPRVDSTRLNLDAGDEWSRKLYAKGKPAERSAENVSQLSAASPKFFKKFAAKDKNRKAALGERIIIGEEGITDEVKMNPAFGKIPKDFIAKFDTDNREDLILHIWTLHNEVDAEKKKVKDLENYLDELLLRVMETTPRILQNPYGNKGGVYIKHK